MTREDWRRERRELQRRRLRRVRWFALFAFIAFLIFVAASFAAAAYTERSTFCENACHEMGPYGRSWQHSAHKDVACVKCHIKPGLFSLVRAKGSALREVYVHFTRQDKAPIGVTQNIPDSTCEESGCHPAGTIKDPVPLTSASALASPNAAASPAGSAPPVAFSHAQHAKRVDPLHRLSLPGRAPQHRRPPLPRSDDDGLLPALPRRQTGIERVRDLPQAGARPRGACQKCHGLASWGSTFAHPVPSARSTRRSSARSATPRPRTR